MEEDRKMTTEMKENMETKRSFEGVSVNAFVVTGYELLSIGKSRIAKAKFETMLDFPEEQKKDMILAGQKALLNNGVVLGYRKNKKIVAMYIIDKNTDSFDCNRAFISENVSAEDQERMEYDIKRQIALLVYSAQFSSGTFFGQKAPGIAREKRPYSLPLALLICLGMGLAIYPATKSIPVAFFFMLSQFALWFAIMSNRLILKDPVEEPADKDKENA